jgi:hypothetical protein
MGAAGAPAKARNKPGPYRCFLVRCWLEEGAATDTEPGWRFTVQEARDGAFRRCFGSMKDVEAYLEGELETSGLRRAGSAE